MNPTTLSILDRIAQTGSITLHGVDALEAVRTAIEEVFRAAGYRVEFDPSSEPDLVDYLTVATASGLSTAALGVGLGMLVGLLFDKPGPGAAWGAGIGFVAGALRGAGRVEQGWRVTAIRAADGTPTVTIGALG